MTGLRAALVLIALVLGAGFQVGAARAGYPVQPNGSIVGSQPSFLVYIDDGETTPQVEVARDSGMNSYVGSCAPSTPFGELHKFSCSLPWKLDPGTYYWTFSYWKRDDCVTYQYLGTYCYLQEHTSAPFQFTVAAPTAPTHAGLVTPGDGATVGATPTLTVTAPAGSTLHVYVANSDDRLNDGSPLSPVDRCGGGVPSDGDYTCTVAQYLLDPGRTYYWWAIIDINGTSWIYGPRSFTVREPSSEGSSSGGSRSEATSSRTAADAPYLQKRTWFRGQSMIHARLSKAVYGVSKYLGAPKMVNVACWNGTDWPSVSGNGGDGFYTTLGFYYELMPHWIQLSPGVCRAIETLLHHRPKYPNRFTSNAIETVTHEAVHALGITKSRYGSKAEALAECYGMQLSILMAVQLGVPYKYADRLAKINLTNYKTRPPQYRNTYNCREDGAWDLFKGHPSPPWHSYR